LYPSLVGSPLYFATLGLLCGAVGFRVGWRARNRFFLPLFQALLGFFAFVTAWRVAGAFGGATAESGWALGSTIAALFHFRRDAESVDAVVLRARSYRESMFAWLRTGRGPEAQPFRTTGRHLVELTAYLVAAVVSANLLALVLGAVLLNYMNAYVVRLLVVARRPWTVRLLAWNCWSLIRLTAYIMLGSACAAPLAARLGRPAEAAEIRWLLYLGAAGVLLDLLLKLALSAPCGRRLADAVEPAALDPAAGDIARRSEDDV